MVWAIVIIIIAGIGGSSDKEKTTKTSAPNTAQEEVKEEDTREITYEKFSQINMGATYEDVKEILGEGEVVTTSEIAGVSSIMYTWINSGGSNMNVTFQNGKVMSKAQIGLN